MARIVCLRIVAQSRLLKVCFAAAIFLLVGSLVVYNGHTFTWADAVVARHIQENMLHSPASSDTPYNFSTRLSESINGQINQVHYIDKILGNLTGGFFIEAGADDGEVYSNTIHFEMNRGWKGLLIEGNPSRFDQLLQKKRKAYSLNTCLSPRNYAEKLNFVNIIQVGGLSEVKPSQKLAGFRQGASADSIKPDSMVQCVTLYSALMAVGNPTVHLLSLDVEGSEEDILRTIPFSLVDIRVILVEVEHSDAAAIVNHLKENGYDLVHNLQNQDYIFVKRATSNSR